MVDNFAALVLNYKPLEMKTKSSEQKLGQIFPSDNFFVNGEIRAATI